MYSRVAVTSAKSNAKRLREQDAGTLDLHRQSLRQLGLLNDRDSVGAHLPPVGGIEVPVVGNTSEMRTQDEAIKAESKRRKEEAKQRELEAKKKLEKERNSLWNWVIGK